MPKNEIKIVCKSVTQKHSSFWKNYRMSLEVGVDSGALGAFLKDVRHVDAHEADPSGGHQSVAQQLDVQVHALCHSSLLQRQGDGGVPHWVSPVRLHVRRRRHSHARLNPRHCKHRHFTGAHFLQPCRRMQHHIQPPRIFHLSKTSPKLHLLPNWAPNPHRSPEH